MSARAVGCARESVAFVTIIASASVTACSIGTGRMRITIVPVADSTLVIVTTGKGGRVKTVTT